MTMIGIAIHIGMDSGASSAITLTGTFTEGSTINLTADEDYVTGLGGTSVEFFEETAGSLGTDATAPWNEEETAFVPGIHRYYIKVDGGPNSPITQINVTPQAPTLTEPDGGETVAVGDTFQFAADDFDETATISLSFHVTGTGYDETFAGVFDTDHWEYDWDTTGLDLQEYDVEAIRVTAGGTIASATNAITVVESFDPLAWQAVLDAAAISYDMYLQADVGISETGGALTSWNDQSASNNDGTAVDAPAYSATGGPDGHGVVTLDGTNDAISTPINPVSPGTTGRWFYTIARLNTWVAAARLIGCDSTNMRWACNSVAEPQTVVGNTTASGALSMVEGTWYRGHIYFNNSATLDHYDLGANTTGTGTAFGNQNPTGLRIGSTTGGVGFSASSWSMIITGTGADLPAQVRTDLDAVTAAQLPSVEI